MHNAGGQKVTSFLLNARNFSSRARLMRLFLGSKGVINGIAPNKIPRPAETNATFGTWFKNNCTILGRFNSMEPEIYELFVSMKQSVHFGQLL